MHPCCYSVAITSLMCHVASVRPCRIRITPKSWNRKWPQVKLRSELTISEQCSENISHKHALSYKKQRPALRVGIRPRRHTFFLSPRILVETRHPVWRRRQLTADNSDPAFDAQKLQKASRSAVHRQFLTRYVKHRFDKRPSTFR